MTAARSSLRRLTPLQAVLTLACLVSGLALLVTLALHLPLSLTLGLLGVVAIASAASVWSRSSPEVRVRLRRRLWFGLRIGLLATLAYDGARLLVVTALGLHPSPFEAVRLFGLSLVGADAPAAMVWIAGLGYHALNGMLFASAYAVLIGGRRWVYGVAWALVLEGLMLSVYPGWLDLSAVMDEFTLMSLSGHVAYGAVLGIGCQLGLGRRP